MKAIINGFLLSNFETSHPEKGNPIIELIGIARRILPNSASFRSNCAFIDGILDAQVAKHSPDKKKYRLKERRWFFFNVCD